MKILNTVLAVLALALAGYALLSIPKKIETAAAIEAQGNFNYEPEQGTGFFNAKSLPLPENVNFAGEKVPMEVPDVRERLDRELHINTYWHNNTIFLMKRANRWFPQIEKILKENNVPDDFKYLAVIEGGLQNVVSPAGATGFWQFMKPASKDFGLKVSSEVDERYDPIKSTRAACKYLNRAYKKFGNWTSVAASYNRGMSGIQRTMNAQNESSYYDLHLPSETARYLFRIIALKEIFSNPTDYGFEIDTTHLYQEETLRYVEVKSSIADLTSFAQEQGINIKLLKRYNPWLRKNKLSIKNGDSYQIAIPLQKKSEGI